MKCCCGKILEVNLDTGEIRKTLIPDKIYEKIFYNYNYVIYFFIFYIISVFIFFRMKKNVFWEKYFYYFLIYMVLISNIFNIGYLIKIYNLFSFYCLLEKNRALFL